MKSEEYVGCPALSRSHCSRGVSGQIHPLNSTTAPHAAAGRCSHTMRGHHNANSPPKRTNRTKARCRITTPSASSRNMEASHLARLQECIPYLPQPEQINLYQNGNQKNGRGKEAEDTSNGMKLAPLL